MPSKPKTITETKEPVRRAELLQIAADLFAERGYAATTVRDIADEAGILSGSLYHHFDSKESMIDAILSSFVAQTLANYEAVIAERKGPRETFEGLVRTSLELMVDWRSAILIYQNEAGFLTAQPRFSYLLDAHRKLERIWTTVLKRASREASSAPRSTPSSSTAWSATRSGPRRAGTAPAAP